MKPLLHSPLLRAGLVLVIALLAFLALLAVKSRPTVLWDGVLRIEIDHRHTFENPMPWREVE